MWEGTRVREAVWPEGLGVITYGGAALAAAAIDVSLTKEGEPVKAIAQNSITGACVMGSAVAIGYGKAVDFSKGLLYGSAVGIVLNLLRIAYGYASAAPLAERTKLSHVGALIPQKVGRVKAARKPGEIEGKGVTFVVEEGKVKLLSTGEEVKVPAGARVGAEIRS